MNAAIKIKDGKKKDIRNLSGFAYGQISGDRKTMKKNGYLDKITDKFLDERTDEERSFGLLREAHVTIAENKRGKKAFSWKKVASVCSVCAVLLVAVCVSFFVFFNTHDIQEEKTYSFANQEERKSSLEELNRVSKIKFKETERSSVICCYDKKYGDDLYYLVLYNNEDTFDVVTVKALINPLYKQDINMSQYDKTHIIGQYDLKYVENIKNKEGLFEITANAVIEYQGEILLIDYEGVSLIEESNFLNVVKDIIAE